LEETGIRVYLLRNVHAGSGLCPTYLSDGWQGVFCRGGMSEATWLFTFISCWV